MDGGEGSPATVDDEVVRYDVPLFSDPGLQECLRWRGYAVHDPILDAGQLAELRALAAEFVSRLDGPVGDLFLTVGRIEDLGLREEIILRAGEVVLPSLRQFFRFDTEFLASAFQVKPPSDRSQLDPHQDSSLVDETAWPGVYAWIALTDTTPRNGGLEVVPGSHRFGNLHRTLSVPWQFAGLEAVMRQHSVPLTVPAGGVVFFDSATIHGSPPNFSDEIRLAVNNFARPPGAALMHFYIDDATTPGMVEAYEIDRSFLYREDIMVRPGSHHRFLGERPHARLAIDADGFDELCRFVGARLATLPVPFD